MTSTIYVSADLRALPGKEDLLRESLQQLVVAVRTEPGCIRYDLHEATDSPGDFLFYETWENEEALDVHNNTEVMKAHVEKAGGWVDTITVRTYRLI
jgi:quinol monooxygenase YgiN